ncbi:MAG: hypothetical protein GEU78_16335 [Actinobacteria bacterium]|nr:hypothetical protein [Actinomycetota bacterium]
MKSSVPVAGGRTSGLMALLMMVALVAPLYAAIPADAAVTATDADLEIVRREVVADGHRFGSTGRYEKLVGTIEFDDAGRGFSPESITEIPQVIRLG